MAPVQDNPSRGKTGELKFKVKKNTVLDHNRKHRSVLRQTTAIMSGVMNE